MEQSAGTIIGSWSDYKDARARQAKRAPSIIGTKEVVINGEACIVRVCEPAVAQGAYLGSIGTVYNGPDSYE